MVITESELREMWRDGNNTLPPFPPGSTFTPSALDFLRSHNLQIQIETAAPGGTIGASEVQSGNDRPVWDKPGEFPVVLSGPLPVCIECGQPVRGKPEHMTQLDAGHFAPKTHPRVRLRGRLDTLHALTMLTAAVARETHLPRLAEYLDSLAAFCREILSAEYNNRKAGPLQIAGKTSAEVHDITHHPDQYLSQAHIVPGPQDPSILHWLNYLRTTAREVEILGLEVYPPPDPNDIVLSLNRFSSGVYFLELLFRKGDISWAGNPFST